MPYFNSRVQKALLQCYLTLNHGPCHGKRGRRRGRGKERIIDAVATSEENFPVNPQAAAAYESLEAVPECSTFSLQDPDVVCMVEIPTTEKPRPLCIKFPIELRKRIIAIRKEGKKSKDIAKELKVSVSGVQKVWERFLATGMVHDRKPVPMQVGQGRAHTHRYASNVIMSLWLPYLIVLLSAGELILPRVRPFRRCLSL